MTIDFAPFTVLSALPFKCHCPQLRALSSVPPKKETIEESCGKSFPRSGSMSFVVSSRDQPEQDIASRLEDAYAAKQLKHRMEVGQ